MTQHESHRETPQFNQQEIGTSSHARISWGTSLRVWWGISWRSLVITIPLAFFLGFAAGVILMITNSSASATAVGRTLGQLATIPASIVAVHWFMNRGSRNLRGEVIRR
jgi:hypothetical protein